MSHNSVFNPQQSSKAPTIRSVTVLPPLEQHGQVGTFIQQVFLSKAFLLSLMVPLLTTALGLLIAWVTNWANTM